MKFTINNDEWQNKKDKVNSIDIDSDKINKIEQILLCNKEGKKNNVKYISDYSNNNT